ncbi:uncharacterized protein N7473_006661 [Penicillium subrubescens]|uniref:uncharacterized protein n=1 Tax=Penicillium subrubescens TaxID=1316194 RepID=UPI0025450003|nr:uncharacterized protein N7473_006661 [Penicillium subrubescens]KAJ5890433.1 hypothetical protein N7473_006661 [Penicillium subrubescens]
MTIEVNEDTRDVPHKNHYTVGHGHVISFRNYIAQQLNASRASRAYCISRQYDSQLLHLAGLGFAATVEWHVNDIGNDVLKGHRGALYMGIGLAGLG